MSAAAPLRIVCVDDVAAEVELIALALERGGLAAQVEHVEGEAALRQALQRPTPLVLCDYHMPGFSAERALQVTQACSDPPALVVVTRAIGEDAAVGLLRAGARDYVPKDKLALLPAVIRRVLAERAGEHERREAAVALARANARLRLLSARLVDAQERERSAIARDLHDSLGQRLTAIAIHVQAAMGQDATAARPTLERVLGLARDAVQEVKSLSFDLRPAQLEMAGLVVAAQAMLDRRLAGSGVQGVLRRRGTPPPAPPPSHAVALRVLQEALTNVLRHAAARRVLVRVHFRADGRLCLACGDDGVGFGFDTPSVLTGSLSERNLGVRGMIERVELLGGQLRFRSRPGRGTVLRLVA